MRHNKLAKQLRKPAKKYTSAEKLHMRREKRKNGPSGVRRRERREKLQRKHAEPEVAMVVEETSGKE